MGWNSNHYSSGDEFTSVCLAVFALIVMLIIFMSIEQVIYFMVGI